MDRQRMAGTIFSANPVDVLREIADLVESVPYGKLKFALEQRPQAE